MGFEEDPNADAVRAAGPAAGFRDITDPRAMRALAHPVRLALLEALLHAGTLTATQASDLLGESPANCAFHLRTLAKYGFVEEAGGGRGRERPWRRVHAAWSISEQQDDPRAVIAAQELSRVFLDTVFERARAALARPDSWPEQWQHTGLDQSRYLAYLTPQEARRLGEESHALFQRYFDRADHPERRPADAMPVEILLLAYPLLHLAGQSAPDTGGVTPPPPGTGQPRTEPRGAGRSAQPPVGGLPQ